MHYLLDRERREISSEHQTFKPLTLKEFKVVEMIFDARGKTVSRQAISKKLFGLPYIQSNVVDVHIKNIRLKCGYSSILSVRGEGYRAPQGSETL